MKYLIGSDDNINPILILKFKSLKYGIFYFYRTTSLTCTSLVLKHINSTMNKSTVGENMSIAYN